VTKEVDRMEHERQVSIDAEYERQAPRYLDTIERFRREGLVGQVEIWKHALNHLRETIANEFASPTIIRSEVVGAPDRPQPEKATTA
jgi:hypothetical protein